MGDDGTVDEAALARTWRHAHEQDSGDTVVFVGPEVDLPPARARKGFSLSGDGTMQVMGNARDDRRTFAPGTWNVTGKTLTLRGAGGEQTYEIVSVDERELVLKRV